MKKAVVIGSGAGGATCAKELQGLFDVTVLEQGGEFSPFKLGLPLVERLRGTPLLLDPREISLWFPAMRTCRAGDGMVLVNGRGTGGTTTLSCGNGLRMDHDLRKLGLDLDPEFRELSAEVPLSTAHQKRWKPSTRELFDVFQGLGLAPAPIPKMGDYAQCRACGRCILGCPYGVKWDSRRFLREALDKGARLITHCRVESIVQEKGRTAAVLAHQGWRKVRIPADLVILAAGGLGTPVILQNSGIPCRPRLFVDPVLTIAADREGAAQDKDVSMPFVSQQDGYILSPYFDYLSFFFHKEWRSKLGRTLGIMIKLADTPDGTISKESVRKRLTGRDKARLAAGAELCANIFGRLGVGRDRLVLGILNAGHPGGMLPLTEAEVKTLHPPVLPANVYVADGTLFPDSLGNPPILTTLALAKRVSRACAGAFA